VKPKAAREPRFSRFPTVLLVSRGASARREAVYRAAPRTLSRAFFSLSNFFPDFSRYLELNGSGTHKPSIVRHSISQIANKAPACRKGNGDNMIPLRKCERAIPLRQLGMNCPADWIMVSASLIMML
jgi:hypothetical protein